MTIRMPAGEVYALAGGLARLAGAADEVGTGLRDVEALGAVQPAVDRFLACHRTGAAALSGELGLLAATVAGVADSWLGLDEVLLAARGRAPRR